MNDLILNPKRCMAFCVLSIFLAVSSVGCSREYLLTKIYLGKAFTKMRQATEMKHKKIPYEGRKPVYEDACQDFLKAHTFGRNHFWLSEIEEAEHACFMAENRKGVRLFSGLIEEYIKKHPKESEYGFLTSAIY